MKKPVIITILILFVFTAVFFLVKDNVLCNKPDETVRPVVNENTNSINMNTPLDSLDPVEQQLSPEELHFDAILVDTHNDFVWQMYYRKANFGKDNPGTQSDLPKFRKGGLDVQVFSDWIPMSKLRNSYSFAVDQIDRLHSLERNYPDDIEFADKYDDIIRIVGEGKICGLIGIEGGTAVENDLDNVNRFFDMGVRYIGLTWNNSNLIASSAKDEVERGIQGGLTDFGVQVVKRMDEVGMIIDISHLGEASFWDVIETSKNPIIASHSNVYSINPHYRNLSDEQIKAIAKSGGVVQVSFHNSFLGGSSLQLIFDHIDYIKNLVGADYVGIGSDFDGGINPPAELSDVTMYPELTKKMIAEGYSQEEVRKILGLNFLRVFKQVCG